MSKDLSKILREWPFSPDDMMVRMIEGDDGRPKMQLRVDLGVLQMEIDGRPDGLKPEGCESWLEYHRRMQQAYDERNPDAGPYLLGEQDCTELWREGMQYYHRYLGFWHLDMYDLCARDTRRNLELFAFVREHATDDRRKIQFDQWRPYVIMMHTRAVATSLIQRKEFSEGLRLIESGIEGIREFLDEYEQSHRAEECVELMSLKQWREEIIAREDRAAAARPQSAAQILRQKLEAAIAAEQFEQAARLRDEIRRLAQGND